MLQLGAHPILVIVISVLEIEVTIEKHKTDRNANE